MNIIEIDSLETKGLEPFFKLTETQLRNRLDPQMGIFIAESPKVIKVALDEGCVPVSLLMAKRHIDGDAQEIISRCPNIPIYTGEVDLLSQLAGFKLTRGVLCAFRRPSSRTVEAVVGTGRRVVVLDTIADATNVGAIFRSAAALGMDAVLLTPTCCDPLNRRSVRVSMGTVFQIPWAYLGNEPSEWPGAGMERLHGLGFKTAAMALSDNSVSIDDSQLMAEEKLAIIMGTEGDGLSSKTIASCDYVVRIPMFHQVDSLNVAAASAVAFWQLRSHH